MAFATEGKNLMLDALAAAITHVSVHSAFPATSGNELAVTRQPITFNPATGGAIDDSNTPVIPDVPGGSTVAALGFWSAASAGTLYADADVADEAFTNAGEYTVDDADLDLNG